MPRRPVRALALAGVLSAVAGLTACGGSEEEAGAAAGATTSAGGAFPVSIENKFGTTEIEAEPQRVVTVGFNDEDFVLALGVTPVGVRQLLVGLGIPPTSVRVEKFGPSALELPKR